jgi:hypothetical protein
MFPVGYVAYTQCSRESIVKRTKRKDCFSIHALVFKCSQQQLSTNTFNHLSSLRVKGQILRPYTITARTSNAGNQLLCRYGSAAFLSCVKGWTKESPFSQHNTLWVRPCFLPSTGNCRSYLLRWRSILILHTGLLPTLNLASFLLERDTSIRVARHRSVQYKYM